MWDRFRTHVRRYGLRETVIEVPRRLAARVYSTSRMTMFRKDLDQIKVPAKESALVVGELDRPALAGLAELNRERGRTSLDHSFQRNVDLGVGGFVGRIGDEIVCYCWWVDAARAAVHPDLAWLGPALQMGPREAYGSDLYILPEHRGQGTAEAMLYGVETGLHERGCEAMWGYVDEGNISARWAYAARGYVATDQFVVRKLFSRRTVVAVERIAGPGGGSRTKVAP